MIDDMTLCYLVLRISRIYHCQIDLCDSRRDPCCRLYLSLMNDVATHRP